MKITHILLILLLCIIVYLLFSFNQVTFDISKWTEGSRDGCASLIGVIIITSVIIQLVVNSESKKAKIF